MDFILGIIIGIIVSGVIFWFVYKNNKKKFIDILSGLDLDNINSDTFRKIRKIIKE
jgi:hypothetical protein